MSEDNTEENEEIIQPEKEINKYDKRALGHTCFICNLKFDADVIDQSAKKSKIGLKDIPVIHHQLPGYIHRRCRGHITQDIIENPISSESVEHLKGGLL